ncbi:hypothetical protein EJB05_43150, partial [Eragrostis curvula]
MLLRRQRSIFHLGEEGGDDCRGAEHVKIKDRSTRHLGESRNQGPRRQERDAVVGLRILVTQQRQHARATPSHIVLKQMVLPTPAARGHHACGFLRSCFRCRRELSPDKDVYMYRGDQGFCSQECRWRQILKDEAREREAMFKKHRRGLSVQHHLGSRSSAAPAVRATPGRLLAVA